MKFSIKKLKVTKSVGERLPVFYNRILYNKLVTQEIEFKDHYEDHELGGFHLYTKSSRPISKIIDRTNINFLKDASDNI